MYLILSRHLFSNSPGFHYSDLFRARKSQSVSAGAGMDPAPVRPVSRPMIAPEGTDTSRSEVMCKVCMDGFGEDQFTKTVKCFQIGFSVTSVAGVQVPDVNSRNNFQPIATCEGAEEDVAPVVFKAWGKHMLRLTGEDHRNVLIDFQRLWTI